MRNHVFICLLLILNLASSAQEADSRPNILWIVSEDTSPLMGCYGDTYATTPNIDRLARNGILYEHAFAPAPVCALSRTTIITGMHATTMGTDNMRSDYPVPEFIKFFPRYLREAGYYTTNNAKKDYNTVDQRNAWNESSAKATYKNRRPGQPFFAVFNIGITHESKIHRNPANLKHDPKKVTLPPYHPDTKEMREDWSLFYDNIEKMDREVGRLLSELEAEGLAENTIVFYYADHGGVIARSKRFVYDAGMRVPLVIRLPSKYASMSADKPGTKSDRLISFADFAPTMMNIAGLKVPEYMEGSPFLGKTLGVERKYAFGLRGRIDESIEMMRTLRDKKFRYIRNYTPHRIYGQPNEYLFQAKSIVSWREAYKAGSLNKVQSVFWQVKPAEELYEIVSDPHNVNNLAANPAYKAVLEKMRKDNQQMMLDMKDTGFIPESMKTTISDSSTTYEFARSSKYPLPRILETGEMATSRNVRDLNELIKRLGDSNDLVRYWAATGCAVLARQALPARTKLKALLTDPQPSVRVPAAEALYKLGETTIALRTLADLISSENLYLRLEALTVLENMGRDAAPVVNRVKEMINKRDDKKEKEAPDWMSSHDVKVAKRIVSANL